MTNKSKDVFTLKTTDVDFQQRQKSVFDQLGVLENNRVIEEECPSRAVSLPKSSSSFDRAYTKQFRGKESIFKKPQNPIPKNFLRKVPDFKKNPHKWTRYSLEDVTDEDISERSNTSAALSFLKEMENRKHVDDKMEQDGEESVPTKITFKRNILVSKPPEKSPEDKPNFHSSKVVMPEYVIGQKVKKDKPKREKVGKGIELKLDHLYEDE